MRRVLVVEKPASVMPSIDQVSAPADTDCCMLASVVPACSSLTNDTPIRPYDALLRPRKVPITGVMTALCL